MREHAPRSGNEPVHDDPSPPPVVVGIAGKYCAGKDEVTRWLLDRGWREVNVDRVGHEALAAKHREIVAAFGVDIIGAGGTIDRRLLGARVFSDPRQLQRLESIVHPWMRERVAEEVAAFRNRHEGGDRLAGDDEHGGDVAPDPATSRADIDTPEKDYVPGLVINAALLFPMGLDRLCDAIILVTAPLFRRVQRARRRDDHSFRHILRRLWSQRGLNAQAYRSPADTITVENGRSLEALHRRLAELPLFRNR